MEQSAEQLVDAYISMQESFKPLFSKSDKFDPSNIEFKTALFNVRFSITDMMVYIDPPDNTDEVQHYFENADEMVDRAKKISFSQELTEDQCRRLYKAFCE